MNIVRGGDILDNKKTIHEELVDMTIEEIMEESGVSRELATAEHGRYEMKVSKKTSIPTDEKIAYLKRLYFLLSKLCFKDEIRLMNAKSMIIEGKAATGKTTLIQKFLNEVIDDENKFFIISDGKAIEYYSYSKRFNVQHIRSNFTYRFKNHVMPNMIRRYQKGCNDELKTIYIVVDEYYEIKLDTQCHAYFSWLVKHRKQLNVEFILSSQVKNCFNEAFKSQFDIQIDLNVNIYLSRTSKRKANDERCTYGNVIGSSRE